MIPRARLRAETLARAAARAELVRSRRRVALSLSSAPLSVASLSRSRPRLSPSRQRVRLSAFPPGKLYSTHHTD
eukprot:31480-Pelagococcus_subviridis.AAC.8